MNSTLLFVKLIIDVGKFLTYFEYSKIISYEQVDTTKTLFFNTKPWVYLRIFTLSKRFQIFQYKFGTNASSTTRAELRPGHLKQKRAHRLILGLL